MVTTAISKKISVYCLTEHMPREAQDLYPEELQLTLNGESHQEPQQIAQCLFELFHNYYHEAQRLKVKYASQITLLVGVEVDWIRASSQSFIKTLTERYPFDLVIGSVHHVHTIPIDYSAELFGAALQQSGGSLDKLYEDYFDLQFEMLQRLQPLIVGHIDLIRLKSDNPDCTFRKFDGTWQRILRNLNYIASYKGIIEINTAALRKGLAEPYPCREICQAFEAKGGQFTLSDDAHGTDQIGTNYSKIITFVESMPIHKLVFLESRSLPEGQGSAMQAVEISITDLKKHPYFTG